MNLEHRLEIFANEQAAEIEALRMCFQTLVVQLFAETRDAAKVFAQMRGATVARADSETKLQSHDQDALRKAHLVKASVEQIFAELAPVFQAPSRNPSTDN